MKKIWFPTIILMIIIAFFSLAPKPFEKIGIEQGEQLDFNYLHIFAYFILSILVGIALNNYKYSYYYAILFCLIYSFILETGQLLIPERTFDLLDILYNLLGISTAQFIYNLKRDI